VTEFGSWAETKLCNQVKKNICCTGWLLLVAVSFVRREGDGHFGQPRPQGTPQWCLRAHHCQVAFPDPGGGRLSPRAMWIQEIDDIMIVHISTPTSFRLHNTQTLGQLYHPSRCSRHDIPTPTSFNSVIILSKTLPPPPPLVFSSSMDGHEASHKSSAVNTVTARIDLSFNIASSLFVLLNSSIFSMEDDEEHLIVEVVMACDLFCGGEIVECQSKRRRKMTPKV
jgi:hypothetical protein